MKPQEKKNGPGRPEDALPEEGIPAAGVEPQASGEKARPENGGPEKIQPAEDGSKPGIPELSQEEYGDLVRKAEERDLYRNELLRAKADFANYQKRILRDRPQIEEQAVRRFVIDLLPVLDNHDRAIAQNESTVDGLKEGIRIVKEMLRKALASHGIEEIEALGKPFDPSLHEAVIHEETDSFPPDSVSEVLEKGYTQRGSVIRPAKVKVAKAQRTGDTPLEDQKEAGK